MTKHLVIVESPTKAKTIEKFLGRNYKVVASGGHLRDLPKSKMGVDIDNNFEPQYINVRGKAPKINELKKLSKNVDRIFLATDPDREGEAISWHLAHLLGLNIEDPIRVEFSEITKEKIKNSIGQPRAINMDLVDAQQARRVMDRIVGYQLSPILWKKVKNGLSAGRVQSVALLLICLREEEIEAFIPEEYWSVKVDHHKGSDAFFSDYYGIYVNGKHKKVVPKSQAEVDTLIDALNKDHFEVKDIRRVKKERKPYAPYTTSTLQQDASNRIGFSTGKTMSVAQQLYEGVHLGTEGSVGLISYMRTDSTRLSNEIIGEALSFIDKTYGKEYRNKGNPYASKGKQVQDAHEGIRPSSIYKTPESIKGYLTPDQYKLYAMIWNRVVASQMKNMVYESTTVELDSNGHLFRVNGSIILFDGFNKVWKAKESAVVLPLLEVGEILKTDKITPEQHFTKPKPRYTEASLVKALEENGIGRPSTYSATIQSILNRNYVTIEKKQFYPTEIGLTVNQLLQLYFKNIINEDFTARMESEFDDIADSEKNWKDVLKGFYTEFSEDLNKAQQDTQSFKIEDEILDDLCPECGKNLVVKSGRNGKFIGCSGFPDCKFTQPILKTIGVDCQKCGGRLVERISKRGKVFYGCENYPGCNYASWDKPTGEKCPKCDDLLIHRKNRRENVIKCNNEACNYEKPYGEMKST